jgi:septum formation protein
MLLHDKLKSYNIILASASPRRRELLKATGIEYMLAPKFECDEVYPAAIAVEDVAPYLSRLKSLAYPTSLGHNDILVTADTTVVLDGEVLGKPKDEQDAVRMLTSLSGRTHEVYTGVCIVYPKKDGVKIVTDFARTEVVFHTLTKRQIHDYVKTGSPMDKAGAYGIQDGGLVKEINGSFSNVVGLPVELCRAMMEKIKN